MLFPEQMTSALLQEIDAMTSSVIPIKERGPRIAALVEEIEQLEYLEEALIAVNGENVQRSTNASPQAVLGVRVVKATSRAA
jgi:hypothetical protein